MDFTVDCGGAWLSGVLLGTRRDGGTGNSHAGKAVCDGFADMVGSAGVAGVLKGTGAVVVVEAEFAAGIKALGGSLPWNKAARHSADAQAGSIGLSVKFKNSPNSLHVLRMHQLRTAVDELEILNILY